MNTHIDQEYSKILEKIAENLDLTPTQYEIATRSYQAVGGYLDAYDSMLKPFRPQIIPQGSFRYGTVTKPWLDGEEYDIDLTCKLHIHESNITQIYLKKLVGDRLKENANYKRMLAPERRRCWRIQYNEGFRFHLDVVPAIPDSPAYIRQLTEIYGVPPSLATHALCITDNETWHTDLEFPKSNPEGYAMWILERMKVEYERRRAILAGQMKLSVDSVDPFLIKTPLQRVIQLLKRHRDVRYGDDLDKPVSIIITTLAAQSYDNEADIFTALRNVLSRMERNIGRDHAGNRVILNPVNPRENFADKWKANPRREKLFFEWLGAAQRDFNLLAQKRGIHELAIPLKEYFGDKLVVKSLNEMGEHMRREREENRLFMESKSGILTSVASVSTVPVLKHTNYGQD